MFKKTRIKLTANYLVIIMIVTLFFSGLVYSSVSTVTNRALLMHERRIELRLQQYQRYQAPPENFQRPINEETAREIKSNTLKMLAFINLTILIFAGGAGYILAGITLKPIEEMLKKHKQFIADAAHELKTPLTAMRTDLEVNLRNSKLKITDAKKVMQNTVNDVESLTLLTNSLLKQSKLQDLDSAGKKNLEDFEIGKIIDAVLIKLKPKIEQKKIRVNTKLEKNVIYAEKSSINELITILIDNAIKFNKNDGSIDISVNKNDGKLILSITDTGIGISKKDVPYVFDRFYKADIARTKKRGDTIDHDGFGLGLSIAKEIVNNHKGSISVESKEDIGTTIMVKLPLFSQHNLSKLI